MPPQFLLLAVLAIVAWLGVMLLLPPLIVWLRSRSVLDLPNERSSHQQPTPRGGGVAVVAVLLVTAIPWVTVAHQPLTGILLAGMMALALLSWFDDRLRGLPILLRLGAQALAVALALGLLPAEATITHGLLPLWLERLFCFFAWLWFTNLFNFMDGINGITGVEMIGVGVGLAVCQLVAGFGAGPAGAGLLVAAAGLGFLRYNWGRAQVFMGDVGSIPVGFLLGGLLLQAALLGLWAAAVILPLYYWLDATLTLLRRLWRREPVWRAHRQHFYQQGARKFRDHAAVARRIAGLNVALVLLSLAAQFGDPLISGLAATALGLLFTALLCRHFRETAAH